MANSHHTFLIAVGAGVNLGEQILFAVFDVSPKRITAQISDLNHAGQFAVNKQRRFNYSLYVSPSGAVPVKFTHHLRVFSGDSVIVVVHNQTENILDGISINVLKVAFEAGDDLLECLFIQGMPGGLRIEVNFVYAFGEQTGKAPICDTIRNFVDEVPTLCQSEMNV